MSLPPLHPACAAFPIMPEDDLAKLAIDIQTNGLREPVVMFNNELLDGRNRWIACERAGVIPATVEHDGSDPIAFVISKNERRRHLPLVERAFIAAALANLANHRPAISPSNEGVTKISQSDAAKAMNVSTSSLQDAHIVKKVAPEAIVTQVKAGIISLRDASTVARGSTTTGMSTMSAADIKAKARASRENPKSPKTPKEPKEPYRNPYWNPDQVGIGPTLTPEERGEPPEHLKSQQHPDHPPGVTYARAHVMEHGRVILIPVAEKARSEMLTRFRIFIGHLSQIAAEDTLPINEIDKLGKDAAETHERLVRHLQRARDRIDQYIAQLTTPERQTNA
jgi:hypothetical protein